MFKINYETRYGDYKDFNTVKVSSVLDMIQDVSTKDSARCGYDMDKLRKMKVAWLLQGINLKIEKPVKTHIDVEVSTAVKTLKGATSARGCYIKQEGEIVAKSIANWFLFNTERQRIGRVSPEMVEAYEFYEFGDPFFEYTKPTLFEIEKPEYRIKIANKEIDTNRHLNNQKGAELLMDALPFEFEFNSINLLYKKQAYLGEELEVCRKEIPGGYYVHMQTPEKEICVAGTFEKV